MTPQNANDKLELFYSRKEARYIERKNPGACQTCIQCAENGQLYHTDLPEADIPLALLGIKDAPGSYDPADLD